MKTSNICKLFGGLLMLATLLSACSSESFDEPNADGRPLVSDYEDNFVVTVDQATNYATFTFKSAPGVSPVWILDGVYHSEYSFTKYQRKAGDYTVECRVKNANGISDGSITKTYHVDKTIMTGFGGFVVDSEYNLWPKGNVNLRNPEPFWYAPGWSQIADPGYVRSGEDWTIKLPTATSEQWQAQMFMTTDIAVSSDKTYDFSLILTSTTDHPHVTVKLGSKSNDGFTLFYNPKVELKAGEPLCVYASDLPCPGDVNDLMAVFDFGGNADDTEITIENIVLKDHANDDGTVLPEVEEEEQPTWVAIDSEDNLWSTATWTNSFYYAPNWGQLPDPTLRVNGRTYTLLLPSATYSQWQAQCAFNTNLTCTDTDQEYDFCVTLTSTTNIGGVTVKLVQTDEPEAKHDGNFFFAQNVDLVADTPKKFWVKQVKAPEAMHAITLVFDFGTNPDNTEVEIADIIFQKHRE